MFIYIVSITIKIVSKHFTKTQDLTPTSNSGQEKLPFRTTVIWGDPPADGRLGREDEEGEDE